MHYGHEYIIPYFLVMPELIVLIILYTRIYVAYKKFVTRQRAFRPDEQHTNKAIVTTLLVVGTFMIGWVPYEPRYEKTFVFGICENKDADQLRGNREADQRLCFRYTDSTIPLLSNNEISSL